MFVSYHVVSSMGVTCNWVYYVILGNKSQMSQTNGATLCVTENVL